MKRSFSYIIPPLFLLLLPTGQAICQQQRLHPFEPADLCPGRGNIFLFRTHCHPLRKSFKGIDVVFNYDCSVYHPNFTPLPRRTATQLGATDYEVLQLNTPSFRTQRMATALDLNKKKTELIRLLQENYRPKTGYTVIISFTIIVLPAPGQDRRKHCRKSDLSRRTTGWFPVPFTFRDIVHQYCERTSVGTFRH